LPATFGERVSVDVRAQVQSVVRYEPPIYSRDAKAIEHDADERPDIAALKAAARKLVEDKTRVTKPSHPVPIFRDDPKEQPDDDGRAAHLPHVPLRDHDRAYEAPRPAPAYARRRAAPDASNSLTRHPERTIRR